MSHNPMTPHVNIVMVELMRFIIFQVFASTVSSTSRRNQLTQNKSGEVQGSYNFLSFFLNFFLNIFSFPRKQSHFVALQMFENLL